MARSQYIYIVMDILSPDFLPVAVFTVKWQAIKWLQEAGTPRLSLWRMADGGYGMYGRNSIASGWQVHAEPVELPWMNQ